MKFEVGITHISEANSEHIFTYSPANQSLKSLPPDKDSLVMPRCLSGQKMVENTDIGIFDSMSTFV